MSPASPSISVLATEAGRLHSLGLVLRALAQVEQSSAGAPRCVYGGGDNVALLATVSNCLDGTACNMVTNAAHGQQFFLMGLLLSAVRRRPMLQRCSGCSRRRRLLCGLQRRRRAQAAAAGAASPRTQSGAAS